MSFTNVIKCDYPMSEVSANLGEKPGSETGGASEERRGQPNAEEAARGRRLGRPISERRRSTRGKDAANFRGLALGWLAGW